MEKKVPEIRLRLRNNIVEVPKVILKASGIRILGRRIKSILFSTDLAIIKNTNADAIIAVYPFTPELSITHAILEVATVPVFCGVGGGMTTGERSIGIALHAELMGAYGVVVNGPMANDVIAEMSEKIDIPVISTVMSECDDFQGKLDAGARILNVSGGANTANIVAKIRKIAPNIPIIATGGPTEESIQKTIDAGANAITYTPPTSAELFSQVMERYRKDVITKDENTCKET